MADSVVPSVRLAEHRRRLIFGLLRAVISAFLLFFLYFLLPLQDISRAPRVLTLVVALLILLGVAVWQLYAITRSEFPGLRAIEALAITAPLFLLLFAATYYMMENSDPASFSPDSMTRIDSLYLTVTTFSTVGFGDITPTSQSARVLVTVQMILNLLVLGVGIRVFIGAVQRGRKSKAPAEAKAL